MSPAVFRSGCLQRRRRRSYPDRPRERATFHASTRVRTLPSGHWSIDVQPFEAARLKATPASGEPDRLDGARVGRCASARGRSWANPSARNWPGSARSAGRSRRPSSTASRGRWRQPGYPGCVRGSPPARKPDGVHRVRPPSARRPAIVSASSTSSAGGSSRRPSTWIGAG